MPISIILNRFKVPFPSAINPELSPLFSKKIEIFCLEDNRKHVHGAVGYVAGPSGLESLKAPFHRLIVFIRNLQA